MGNIIKTFESFTEDDDKEYKFEELSPRAKDHAIEQERNSIAETMDDWDTEILEEFEKELGEIDITNVDIQYTGFNSQGDGASFTGVVNNIKNFVIDILGMKIPDVALPVLDEIAIEIVRTDRQHYHENSVTLVVSVNGEDEVEVTEWLGVEVILDVQEQCDAIEPIANEWLKNKCRELYKRLEKEYDSAFEEDRIKNHLIDSDYLFDEKGNMI
jgi:hypothetical protein